MKDIVIRNISKKYKDEQVIKDFSYTFSEGERYCIMGTSGVGKTTILNMLLRIEQPDFGEIEVGGNCSVVFQENRLIENLTPVTNVKMVLQGVKEDAVRRELSQILPEGSLDKRCSELSGGMKRRVAIVRAVLHSSDYLIMDEPFSGLDDVSKKETMAYIMKNLRGRTLIFVSHDREDAAYMYAQICVLTRN